MHPLERYLVSLSEIHRTGSAVKETSYYTPLDNLLNEIGKTLKPTVRCMMTVKNTGAGIPDGGLFTADQLRRGGVNEAFRGQLPARGVLEIKGPGDKLEHIAASEQVRRYLERYGQVLVTNYRDFVLVGRDRQGRRVELERYTLAADEASFWRLAARPDELVAAHGERFVEYLRRVMLHGAPLATPEDVAWMLASYARDARARLERSSLPSLGTVRTALEESLGIRFEAQRGEHFFRSTLVQTLFYGVFSAWVLWCRKNPDSDPPPVFEWRMAAWSLHVPMIRALFEQLVVPSRLEPLGLVEVLDWTAAALNRVERDAFFRRFEQEHAVQYFYEPFLEAFDPELRRELGVWYTPPEVVRYMVARIDHVLRSELGIPDGLADRRVIVLDPCCGTGAYVVEVLRRIGETLAEQGMDALRANDLKRAALERIFGFELLPAPFVVAHLQLGLLLQQQGVPLAAAGGERAAVYLTNALTGWDALAKKQRLPLLELEEERDAAEKVKRETPILVVLGNPPYNGYAGMAVEEERELSNAYRRAKRAPQPQGQGLNDLYVRFFRMAERRIVEHGGRGVVCFISNYSWLDGLSFTGMRERYLEAFDKIWIDSLNGDKYKTGKLTPEGKPDPSIFSTEANPEGIQVGTAIAAMVRKTEHVSAQQVLFRNLWGKGKRRRLLDDVGAIDQIAYEAVMPALDLGLPFSPATVSAGYLAWPLLPELFPVSFPGVKTSRDDVVVDIDRARLEQRMRQYFDPAISHEQMKRIAPGAMESTQRFDAVRTRNQLHARGFRPENIMRYAYRPFDVRWLYWEPDTKLLDEKRAEYLPHVFRENVWLTSTTRSRKGSFYQPQIFRVLADLNIIEANVQNFPLYLKPEQVQRTLFDEAGSDEPRPNLSEKALAYLEQVGGTAEDLFMHALAVLHSPAYRAENAGALRQDWPRVPLPANKAELERSAALGWRLAALLDPQSGVSGVTEGAIRPELRRLGAITRAGGGQLDPAQDLALTAGWGHAGKGGATMPGQGKVIIRDYASEELEALDAGLAALGLLREVALGLLGDKTLDIYLNGVAYWRNVPARVWAYTLGGYQVLKKWLSYREEELLGRPLTADEVREFTLIARRIAAILLLETVLDENYWRITVAL